LDTVEARRVLLYYWAVWELVLSAVELVGRLGIFSSHGQPIGQTERKDRKRQGTQGSEMIYANISTAKNHVPKKHQENLPLIPLRAGLLKNF